MLQVVLYSFHSKILFYILGEQLENMQSHIWKSKNMSW
jgi:hypothetical protein